MADLPRPQLQPVEPENDGREPLRAERDRLRNELDVLERRFRDLGDYRDRMQANVTRTALWDVEEKLRRATP